MSIEEINKSIKSGKPTEALQLIEKTIEQDFSKEFDIDLFELKFLTMNKLGMFDKCIQAIDLIIQDLHNPLHKARILINKISAFQHLGRLPEGRELIKTIKDDLTKIEDKDREYENILAKLFNIEGLINLRLGDYDLASYFINRGLNIAKKVDNEEELARHYNSLATLHLNKGEINECLEFYTKAFEIYQKYGDLQDSARLLNNLGEVYRLKGHLDKSIYYYEKSNEYLELVGNELQIMANLFNLINIYIISENQEKAIKYFEKMKAKNPNLERNIIKVVYLLSQALILKQSNRISDLAKAEEIFHKIAYDENILSQELTEIAMINLANYYFAELLFHPDQSTFEDFINISKRIEEISQKQQNWRLQAVSFDLKAKIALINLNIKEATNFIIEAEFLARERGLESLAKRFSVRSDHILEHFDEFSELENTDIDLHQRIRILNMKQLADNIDSTITVPDFQISSEIPVILIILNAQTGAKLTSYSFSENVINENLLAGLLSAIQSLSQSIFSSSGIIERLKYEKYTISFRIIDDLLFSYVFTGPSYYVHQKFDTFIGEISDFTWFKETTSSPITKIENQQLEKLNELIYRSFK